MVVAFGIGDRWQETRNVWDYVNTMVIAPIKSIIFMIFGLICNSRSLAAIATFYDFFPPNHISQIYRIDNKMAYSNFDLGV